MAVLQEGGGAEAREILRDWESEESKRKSMQKKPARSYATVREP